MRRFKRPAKDTQASRKTHRLVGRHTAPWERQWAIRRDTELLSGGISVLRQIRTWCIRNPETHRDIEIKLDTLKYIMASVNTLGHQETHWPGGNTLAIWRHTEPLGDIFYVRHTVLIKRQIRRYTSSVRHIAQKNVMNSRGSFYSMGWLINLKVNNNQYNTDKPFEGCSKRQ